MNLAEISNSRQLSAVTGGRRRTVPYAAYLEGEMPAAREASRTAILDEQRNLSLAQSARQFDEEMALRNEELETAKKQADTATAIQAANLAVTGAYVGRRLGLFGGQKVAEAATLSGSGAAGAGESLTGAANVYGGGPAGQVSAGKAVAGKAGGGPTAGGAAGVLAIIAAADMARQKWGELDKPYEERSPRGKFTAAPVTGGPAALATAAGVHSGNYFMKQLDTLAEQEEEIVGKSLDKAFQGDIFGSVGSFVSGSVKAPFKVLGAAIGCFCAGTPVRMADGTEKAAEEIDLLDEVLEGGTVIGKGVVLSDDIYEYRGVRLSSEHAVLENGRWIRVGDSHNARPAASRGQRYERVYPLVTQGHILIVGDIIFADYAETDQGTHVNDAQRLAYLNEQWGRIRCLEERYHADQPLREGKALRHPPPVVGAERMDTLPAGGPA